MKERLSLALRPSEDRNLDCLVCRRLNVDFEIVYGTSSGHAAQGIHERCIGRAERIKSGRRGLWQSVPSRSEER